MDTLTKPVTRVRMSDSGGIKIVAADASIKASVSRDDKSDVRLPETAYRIVMQCRNAGDAKTKKSFTK